MHQIQTYLFALKSNFCSFGKVNKILLLYFLSSLAKMSSRKASGVEEDKAVSLGSIPVPPNKDPVLKKERRKMTWSMRKER